MPEAPYHSKNTANAADAAKQLVAAAIYGRKVILTGYPVATTDPAYGATIYIGYDATVDATHFAFAMRTGDISIDESAGPWDRRTPHIFWFKVDTNGAGLAFGVE